MILQESKISVGVRSIFCIVEKAEAKWWKKLVRDDQKAPHFVKVDWDKWVDEDDDGKLCTSFAVINCGLVFSCLTQLVAA